MRAPLVRPDYCETSAALSHVSTQRLGSQDLGPELPSLGRMELSDARDWRLILVMLPDVGGGYGRSVTLGRRIFGFGAGPVGRGGAVRLPDGGHCLLLAEP